MVTVKYVRIRINLVYLLSTIFFCGPWEKPHIPTGGSGSQCRKRRRKLKLVVTSVWRSIVTEL
jgi:hypothetical protein